MSVSNWVFWIPRVSYCRQIRNTLAQQYLYCLEPRGRQFLCFPKCMILQDINQLTGLDLGPYILLMQFAHRATASHIISRPG